MSEAFLQGRDFNSGSSGSDWLISESDPYYAASSMYRVSNLSFNVSKNPMDNDIRIFVIPYDFSYRISSLCTGNYLGGPIAALLKFSQGWVVLGTSPMSNNTSYLISGDVDSKYITTSYSSGVFSISLSRLYVYEKQITLTYIRAKAVMMYK